jgi:putative ABC transport system permease protein
MAHTIAADPSVMGVAQSGMTPFDGTALISTITVPESGQNFSIRNDNIDPEFLRVYDVKLLAGRNLSRDRGNDIYDPPKPGPNGDAPDTTANVLINVAAARQFGFTVQNAVGRTVLLGAKNHVTIVGVVSNVNFDGLETGMQPFFYYYRPKDMGSLSVRIRPGRTQEALAAVDRAWHRFMPNTAIRRRFQDASFDKFFVSDEREGRIFGIFVGLAIFIACLGLFGLASFTAERRTKEIGIRKVHGARTRDIVRLLLWQFSKPVLLANLIAWPVAWYYLQDWLKGYAYRIPLSPLYFLAAGLVALLIAWATVIFHTVLVARSSPIAALRYE